MRSRDFPSIIGYWSYDNKRRIIGIFNIKSDEKRREMRRLHEKCLFDVRNHFHSSLFCNPLRFILELKLKFPLANKSLIKYIRNENPIFTYFNLR